MAPKAKAILKRPAAKPLKEPEPVEEAEEDDDAEEPEEEEPEEEEGDEEEEEPVQAPSPKRSPPVSKSSPIKAVNSSPPKKRKLDSPLQVRYTAPEVLTAPLAEGLVQLRRKLHRCDAAVLAGGGARIPVHAVVLASQSPVLDQKLEKDGPEIDLGAVSHEAADHLVRWIYGEAVDPTHWSQKANEEVLRLASELALPLLSQVCSSRLAVDVTIHNVVERVRLCEDFGLPALRAALVEALVEDRPALDAVARNEATLTHPALMRELLARIAADAIETDAVVQTSSRPSKQQRAS